MNKNIDLVLSSGGARGIAHIGVIEQLETMGYKIKSISGTSIGALIGGLHASGNLKAYKNWVSSLDKGSVFSLMDFQLKAEGFIKGEKVFDHMSKWLDGINIEDLPIHFTAVASDIINREEVVFTDGSLSEAIRASVAVPGFITPVYKDGNWLFDGGVVNPIPLNRVKRTENSRLLAVDLNAFVPVPNKGLEEKEQDNVVANSQFLEMISKFNLGTTFRKESKKFDLSYFTLMTQMFDMMQEQISKFYLEQFPPDIVINIPRDICNTFDFHKSEEMVELGKSLTIKAFSEV